MLYDGGAAMTSMQERQFKSAPSIAPLALSLALERKVTETVGDFLETEGHSEGTGGRFLGRINRGDDG